MEDILNKSNDECMAENVECISSSVDSYVDECLYVR